MEHSAGADSRSLTTAGSEVSLSCVSAKKHIPRHLVLPASKTRSKQPTQKFGIEIMLQDIDRIALGIAQASSSLIPLLERA